jgi:hypothetical protein
MNRFLQLFLKATHARYINNLSLFLLLINHKHSVIAMIYSILYLKRKNLF